MLSGWTTHGRLSCPYCQDSTDVFQLKHGRKTSWFDCHKHFLPTSHPYCCNRRMFKKNRIVEDDPPPEIDGHNILKQLRNFDVEKTTYNGGSSHIPVDGYGEYHNWHKKVFFGIYLIGNIFY